MVREGSRIFEWQILRLGVAPRKASLRNARAYDLATNPEQPRESMGCLRAFGQTL